MSVTTELEAINTALSAIQAQPVSSLTGQMSADLSVAINVLAEIRRTVCLRAWAFNSEEKVVYSPASSTGFINLPSDVLRADVHDGYNTDVDVVQRGTKLYDKIAHSYVFSSDLTCDVVKLLAWNDLPEAVRRYIMIRTARVMVDRLEGEQLPHIFAQADENQALADLKEFEGDSADYNILDGWAVGRAVNRPSVINRIR